MILMTVGQPQSPQIIALFFKKRDIWKDQVDAGQMFFVTERNAKIDRKPASLMAIAKTIDRQVHADLTDAA